MMQLEDGITEGCFPNRAVCLVRMKDLHETMSNSSRRECEIVAG
jgi:hypothetical protein